MKKYILGFFLLVWGFSALAEIRVGDIVYTGTEDIRGAEVLAVLSNGKVVIQYRSEGDTVTARYYDLYLTHVRTGNNISIGDIIYAPEDSSGAKVLAIRPSDEKMVVHLQSEGDLLIRSARGQKIAQKANGGRSARMCRLTFEDP